MGKNHGPLLNYYQEEHFNPVKIPLNSELSWEQHKKKRRNLYENHLGIPLHLLKDKRVLEFGCNSGENALVLASHGASLTLVEPNEQVIPRLYTLFDAYSLAHQVDGVFTTGITDFQGKGDFDLVLAEGFLYCLTEPQKALEVIVHSLAPEGLGVITFNDSVGGFIECLRRAIFQRACELASVTRRSSEALGISRQFFEKSFNKIQTSRDYESWHRDVLINPAFDAKQLVSWPKVLDGISQVKAHYYRASPNWPRMDAGSWYKNISELKKREEKLLLDWRSSLSYFITGLPEMLGLDTLVSSKLMLEVESCSRQMVSFLDRSHIEVLEYPKALSDYFMGTKNDCLVQLNAEFYEIFDGMNSNCFKSLMERYHKTIWLKDLWGVPYHYLAFQKGKRECMI